MRWAGHCCGLKRLENMFCFTVVLMFTFGEVMRVMVDYLTEDSSSTILKAGDEMQLYELYDILSRHSEAINTTSLPTAKKKPQLQHFVRSTRYITHSPSLYVNYTIYTTPPRFTQHTAHPSMYSYKFDSNIILASFQSTSVPLFTSQAPSFSEPPRYLDP